MISNLVINVIFSVFLIVNVFIIIYIIKVITFIPILIVRLLLEFYKLRRARWELDMYWDDYAIRLGQFPYGEYPLLCSSLQLICNIFYGFPLDEHSAVVMLHHSPYGTLMAGITKAQLISLVANAKEGNIFYNIELSAQSYGELFDTGAVAVYALYSNITFFGDY